MTKLMTKNLFFGKFCQFLINFSSNYKNFCLFSKVCTSQKNRANPDLTFKKKSSQKSDWDFLKEKRSESKSDSQENTDKIF